MDDVWDEDGREPGELKKIERDHGDAGYLRGVTASKEKAHQPGFDEGYSEGAQIGLIVGHIIGSFQALGLHDMEQRALKELSPQELFSYKYYDANARPNFSGTKHPIVVKWQEHLKNFTTN